MGFNILELLFYKIGYEENVFFYRFCEDYLEYGF